MPVTPIKDLGMGGLNKDTSPILLPENVFTDARNVRFRNNSVETFLGESSHRDMATLDAKYGIHWSRSNNGFNIYAKDGYITKVTAAGVETAMLSSGGYIGSRWQMGTFGGGYAVFFNNGNSTPLYALEGDPTADLVLQPFPGWNYTFGLTVTAKVIRSFNYSLIAANFTLVDDSGTTLAPTMIRISAQAGIGGFPSIWQPGLTTDTADEFLLNATTPVLDMLELRGSMFIYTSDSIHVLSLVNGIANVRPYVRGYGVLNIDCVTEVDGTHIAVDRNDIYMHSGNGKCESLIEGRMRDFFLGDISQTYAQNSFVVKNKRYKEVWVCYPNTASTTGKCNRAMIFNYTNNTWTIRDLPEVTYLFQSPSIEAAEFSYGEEIILGCTETTKVLQLDDSNTMFDGTTFNPIQSYLERAKLSNKDPFGDTYISGIAPVFEVDDPEAVVSINLHSQNIFDKAPDYSNTSGRDLYTISPQSESQGYKVDPRSVGRFLNMKISSDKQWKLSFLGLDSVAVNRR